jgi:hypothetical protein
VSGKQAASAAVTRPRGSVISPTADLLLVGGLSLILFVPLLLSGRKDLVLIGAGAQAWLATTINMPHFMASYRIVYRSRDMIMRHKWASLFVPALLLAYIAFAIAIVELTSIFVIVLVAVAGIYLAWHYTGQVWGMMASHAYLAGSPFTATERTLVRTSLRVLLAWHLAWFAYTTLRDPTRVQSLYVLLSGGTVLAFAIGSVGLGMMYRRTGKVPPAGAIVAWLAIFSWYALMARDPSAIFWVQIAHALQYLAFPIRVEINRAENHHPGTAVRHMAVYGVALLIVSYVMAQLLPASAMSIVGGMFGEEGARAAPVLILMFINIHHYFTDGVIWKISNPEVRKELFAHVPPPPKPRDPGQVSDPGHSMKSRRKVRK